MKLGGEEYLFLNCEILRPDPVTTQDDRKGMLNSLQDDVTIVVIL